MPLVKPEFRIKLDTIKNLLAKVHFYPKYNNDLTAWTVLALQDSSPKKTKAGFDSLALGSGIRDILDYCRENGTVYAENTRESVRKHSIKYLVDAGIAIRNHDDPSRPTNSAKTNYILNREFIKILESESIEQIDLIEEWNESRGYEENQNNWRVDQSLEVKFGSYTYQIHPSEHNLLEKLCIDLFLPYFSKNFEVLYFSDTDNKSLHHTKELDQFIGEFDVHKKLPDLIALDKEENTLFLIEAVASVGEINNLRKKEIDELITSTNGMRLRYISVFKDRREFRKFSDTISNGTEVWIVETNPHVIYFKELNTTADSSLVKEYIS